MRMFKRIRWSRIALGLIPPAAGLVLLASSNPLPIRLRDRCDPATFNLAIGPGTCVGTGNITIPEFIAELQEDQKVGAWNINPDKQEVDRGTALILESRGGEAHTFTKVEEFGGGFVEFLNGLSGNFVPRPECTNGARDKDGNLIPLDGLTFVPPGLTLPGPVAGTAAFPAGHKVKFQCCIHPWMRTELTVK